MKKQVLFGILLMSLMGINQRSYAGDSDKGGKAAKYRACSKLRRAISNGVVKDIKSAFIQVKETFPSSCDDKDDKWKNPFIDALKRHPNNPKIIKALLDAGADPYAETATYRQRKEIKRDAHGVTFKQETTFGAPLKIYKHLAKQYPEECPIGEAYAYLERFLQDSEELEKLLRQEISMVEKIGRMFKKSSDEKEQSDSNERAQKILKLIQSGVRLKPGVKITYQGFTLGNEKNPNQYKDFELYLKQIVDKNVQAEYLGKVKKRAEKFYGSMPAERPLTPDEQEEQEINAKLKARAQMKTGKDVQGKLWWQ